MSDISRVSTHEVLSHRSMQTNDEIKDFNKSKRDLDDGYSEEKGRKELVDILEHLRGYVSGYDIDYDTYDHEFEHLRGHISEAEHFIVNRLDVLSEELRITKRFYNSFGDAQEMFENCEGRDCTGLERAARLMDLNVRVVSLYRFENLGESTVDDYEAQISGLKSELKDLEAEPRESMVQDIEAIFTEQLKKTKESFSLVEKSNLPSSTGRKTASQTPKKSCPAT